MNIFIIMFVKNKFEYLLECYEGIGVIADIINKKYIKNMKLKNFYMIHIK